MHPSVVNLNLRPADVIVVPKSNWKIIGHHAVYLGQDFNGTDLFAENNNLWGVRLITAEQFFNENPTHFRINRFTKDNYQRELAVKRALSQLGKPYKLINFNCEHFSSYVQTGYPVSKQAKTGIGIALGLALLIGGAFAFSRK